MIRMTVYGCLIFVLGCAPSLTNAMQCGFNTNNLRGTISGPLSSGSYQQYSFECVWTITAPYGYKILLEATSFNLPGSTGSCHTDSVEIESLWGNNQAQNHGTFCGSSYPPKILSKENKLRIRYKYKGDRYRRTASYFSFSHNAEPHATVPYLTGEWIKNNTQKFFEHKANLPRIISSIFLFNESYFVDANATLTNLTTQYRLHLAGDLVRNSTHPLTAAALSHHVTALLALCSNPRSFYGVNLVEHLRSLVNSKDGLVNPYYLLTLCNAGDKLTASDIKKLKAIIELYKKDIFWLDFQAMAFMALVCAEKSSRHHEFAKEIRKASVTFKNHQLTDGSFGSLQTTSLVVQALAAAETSDFGWNKTSAFEYVERLNSSDGSFGNFYNLFSAIPVIKHKTLLYINASKCDFKPEGLTPLDEIEDRLAEPIHIFYSLWIGDQVDFSYTVTLKVPNGTKFLDFMRLAAETDKKFQFKWTYVKGVPYVYQIYGLVNDPASGKYWTLLTGTQMWNVKPHLDGLENYVPGDGEMAVMWYKTIVINHPWNEIDVKSANMTNSSFSD